MKVRNENRNQKPVEDQLDLTLYVSTETSDTVNRLSFTHTKHSFSRGSQRGICNNMIGIAIKDGIEFFKQGLIFYVLGQNNIPEHIPAKKRKKFRNLVVVVSGSSNQIITCYRNDDPFKYIRSKSKQLVKRPYSNAA
jgi:hypothetical protein